MQGSLSALDRAELERVLLPAGSSYALPRQAYTDEGVFAWEMDELFGASWVCVAHTGDLRRPGDRIGSSAGRDGVFVVRDEAGLGAFFDVCAHRGHEVVGRGVRGSGRVMKCAYHGWVYGADGKLRAAPNFERDPGDIALTSVAMDTWRGWVFVNPDGRAGSLDRYTGNLDDVAAPYAPETLVLFAEHVYTVPANWKLIVENYHECYHCPQIHPELCRVAPPDSGYRLEPEGEWIGGTMELDPAVDSIALGGRPAGTVLPGLDARRRREAIYVDLFPNLLIGLHPDYVMAHRLEPLAPNATRVECRWYFAAQPGPDPQAAVDLWHLTNEQDWAACASVQRGLSGRGYSPGPLSPKETSLYRFARKIARRYLDAGER